MLQGFIFHNSHDSRDTNTIISAKCCIIRIDPSIHNVCHNWISLKVMITIWSLLWNHVHVSLQQNCLTVFKSRCSRLAHYNIATSIYV